MPAAKGEQCGPSYVNTVACITRDAHLLYRYEKSRCAACCKGLGAVRQAARVAHLLWSCRR